MKELQGDKLLSKTVFGDTVSLASFRVVRSKLGQKVMNVLRNGMGNKSVRQEMNSLLDEAEIWAQRSIPKAAYDTLKEVIRIARKNEIPVYELAATQQILGFVQAVEGNNAMKRCDEYVDSLKQLAQTITEATSIYSLYYEATRMMNRSAIVRRKEDREKIEHLLKELSTIKHISQYPFKTQCHYYRAHYWLWLMKGDFGKALKYSEQDYLITKKSYLLKRLLPQDMFNVHEDYIGACLSAKAWKKAENAIEEFTALREKQKGAADKEATFLGADLYYRSHYLLLRGKTDITLDDHKNLITYYEQIEKGKLTPAVVNQRVIELQLARLYLANSDYYNAKKFSDRLVDVKSTTDIRAEIVDAARFLHVIILFERAFDRKGNSITFRDIKFIEETQRFYDNIRKLKGKYKDNYALEELFFRFFINLDTMTLETFCRALKGLTAKIRELKSHRDNVHIKGMLQMVDIEEWAEKKLREVMRPITFLS